MTDKKHLIGYGLILSVLFFVGYQYIQSVKSLQEMNTVIQLKEKENEELKAKDRERDKQLQELRDETESRLSAIERKRASVKTPQQALTAIQSTIPLSQTATVAAAPDIKTVLSQEDAKKLADLAFSMQELQVKVESLEKESKLKDEKILSLQTQLANVTKERDVAVKAAKGGGFWRRTLTAAKYIGIGIGIGFAVAHH